MKLPTPAKIILWVCIVGGAWNTLFGLLFLLSPDIRDDFNDAPGMIYFMLVVPILALMFLVSSVLSLKLFELGRKMFLGCLVLGECVALAWGVFFINTHLGPSLFGMVASIPGFVIPLVLVIISFRYFNSQKIKNVYAEQASSANPPPLKFPGNR